jgi:hypothetical protein
MGGIGEMGVCGGRGGWTDRSVQAAKEAYCRLMLAAHTMDLPAAQEARLSAYAPRRTGSSRPLNAVKHRQRLKPSCSAPLRPCPNTTPHRVAEQEERAREGSARPPVRPQALRAIGFATSQSDRAPERDLHFFQYIFRDTYARAPCSLLRAPLPSPVGAGRRSPQRSPVGPTAWGCGD